MKVTVNPNQLTETDFGHNYGSMVGGADFGSHVLSGASDFGNYSDERLQGDYGHDYDKFALEGNDFGAMSPNLIANQFNGFQLSGLEDIKNKIMTYKMPLLALALAGGFLVAKKKGMLKKFGL